MKVQEKDAFLQILKTGAEVSLRSIAKDPVEKEDFHIRLEINCDSKEHDWSAVTALDKTLNECLDDFWKHYEMERASVLLRRYVMDRGFYPDARKSVCDYIEEESRMTLDELEAFGW